MPDTNHSMLQWPVRPRLTEAGADAWTRASVEKAATGGWAGLAQGRHQATILFADIVASSHLVGGADPEEARDRLNAILDLMEAQIQRFGGTLCPTLGDGVMAVFGAPRAQEDHAVRACFAADAVVQAARASADRPDWDCPPFSVRVGVASGEILWDSLSHRRADRSSAVGEPVHLAAKLQQRAEINGIAVAGATADLVADWVEVRPNGSFDLAPQRHVSLFSQVGIRRQRQPSGGALPFIGREKLVADLTRALDAAAAGRGSAHLVLGDAGMGKTRLVQHLLQRCGEHHVLLWPQQAVRPVGMPEPLWQVAADLLGPDVLESRPALESRLSRAERLSAGAAQALADTLFPQAGVAADPGRLSAAAEALAQLAVAEAARRPLVILVEDLHWAGAGMLTVVERLAERCFEGRLALLATARSLPEGSGLAAAVKTHRLHGLGEQAARRLFDSAAAGSPALAGVRDALIARAEGNPFYLMQSVQALLDDPDAADQGRVGRLPATIQGLLAARIDGLEEGDRTALWAASVVGPTVDVPSLAVLLGTAQVRAQEALARLADSGFLDQVRILPRVEFGFRHALIHEAAYAALTRRDRRQLHGKLAKALQEDWAADLPGRDEAVARHAHAGELWHAALEFGWKAATQAKQHCRTRECVELLQWATEALDAMGAAGDPVVSTPESLDLRLERLRLTMSTGRRQSVDEQVERILEAARRAGDVRRESLALTLQSTFESVYGHMGKALTGGESALSLARACGDQHVICEALIRLGMLRFHAGDFAGAVRSMIEADAFLADHPTAADRVVISGRAIIAAALARAEAELGNAQSARRWARRCAEEADRRDHVITRMYAAGQLGLAYASLQDHAACRAAMEDCIALSDAAGSGILRSVARAGLGFAQTQLGAIEEGLLNLRAAVVDLEHRQMAADSLTSRIWLSIALVDQGDTDGAWDVSRSLPAAAEQIGATGLKAWALYAQAYAQEKRDPSASTRSAEHCITLASTLGMRRLAERARLLNHAALHHAAT